MANADAAQVERASDLLPTPRGLLLEPAEPAISGAFVLSFSLEPLPPFHACEQPITASERQVLGLLLDGASNRKIAAERGTSERTVANQVASIFRKMGVGSRLDLAVTTARRRDQP